MSESTGWDKLRRRDFLKSTVAAVAAGSLSPRRLAAEVMPSPQALQLMSLGNGEPPAIQFQAYPGGTGALMERLWQEHGEGMFRRDPIEVEPWQGPVPTSEEDLAFLPVHRLSALIRERLISSLDLTESTLR